MANWDTRFLSLAELVASWSRDPSTKVGCVLVDDKHRVISLGFNGLPRGVPDAEYILSDRETKLRIIIHAEENSLYFAASSTEKATCYVWPLPPCAKCAAKLAQAGVKRVVTCKPTLEQSARWGEDWKLADWVYTHAGIEIVYHWEAQA